jgi:hypothetical protein
MLIIFLFFAYTLEAASWHGTVFPKDIGNIFKGLNIFFCTDLGPNCKKEKKCPSAAFNFLLGTFIFRVGKAVTNLYDHVIEVMVLKGHKGR